MVINNLDDNETGGMNTGSYRINKDCVLGEKRIKGIERGDDIDRWSYIL
jgi:hypothetical protein